MAETLAIEAQVRCRKKARGLEDKSLWKWEVSNMLHKGHYIAIGKLALS